MGDGIDRLLIWVYDGRKIQFAIKEGEMGTDLCEKCLSPVEEVEKKEEGNILLKCENCNHETPYSTGLALELHTFFEGQRKIKEAVLLKIKEIIRKDSESKSIKTQTEGFDLKLSTSDLGELVEALGIGKKISREMIRKVGTSSLRKLIEKERRELQELVGEEVRFETAAAMVAHLYDVEKQKKGKIIIQTIENLNQQQEFMLSTDIKSKSLLDRQILYPLDFVYVLLGNAEVQTEKLGSGHWLSKIVLKKLPTVLIYVSSSSSERDSKVYIFK